MEKVRIRKHKRAFICSPLRPRGATAGQRADDLRHNRQLAQLGCRYAVSLGYLPMAPHLFFPEFLSEDRPEEREKGIQFGLEWLSGCDELWVIGNRITEGMKREIALAKTMGTLPSWKRAEVHRKSRAQGPDENRGGSSQGDLVYQSIH